MDSDVWASARIACLHTESPKASKEVAQKHMVGYIAVVCCISIIPDADYIEVLGEVASSTCCS